MEVQLHAFLTLALDGGEWSSCCVSYMAFQELDPFHFEVKNNFLDIKATYLPLNVLFRPSIV